MFVVGISCTKPKTRAFVTERTWAYQTKSAFSDAGYITVWRLIRNGHGCRGGQWQRHWGRCPSDATTVSFAPKASGIPVLRCEK